MKNKYAFITFFLLVINFSCNEDRENYHINSFFENTSWMAFNTKTLKENNLEHFVDNNIDFFHRESFFSFMKNTKYDNSYNEFYFIEIETKGEVNESEKILLISLNNKMTSLAFKRVLNKWEEFTLSADELKKYNHENLEKKFRESQGEYILITEITCNLYK